MNKELDQLVETMRRMYGQDLVLYDESFLAKSLDKRLAATHTLTVTAYLDYLAENRAEPEELFRSLNITYSEFFRNPLAFALLETAILPKLVEEKSGRGEIRIWSAGCAAGQEPYSVAILLDELAGARGKPIPFRIFATDHAESELAVARRGVYDYAAVQNVRLKHLRHYFAQHGETFTIAARLRDRMDFSSHDLLDGRNASPPASIYGDFDLVFCSNLLFYYRADIQQLILNQVCRALAPNGYLVTGEAERAIVEKTPGLRVVAPPAAVFQKR
jgi:chemotaxis protein methyltransferase CheR